MINRILLFLLLFTVNKSSFAQNQQIEYEQDSIDLEEVTISASRFTTNKGKMPHQITSINKKNIEYIQPLNTASLLESIPHVFVQKSQLGGGSPVIRGMESNRLLISVDGVRMNNAIFRAGHLQNILRISPFFLDRVEVINGPGTIIYGSDAMGGVMYFHTHTPKNPYNGKRFFLTPKFAITTSYPSFQLTPSVLFDYGNEKWLFSTGASYGIIGDTYQGKSHNFINDQYHDLFLQQDYVQTVDGVDTILKNNEKYRQIGSNYEQINLFQKIMYQPNLKNTHTLTFQLSNTSNVARYDRLSDRNSAGIPSFSEWYYGPEYWQMLHYNFKNYSSSLFYDHISFDVNQQHFIESRHSRKYKQSNLKVQEEDVNALCANIDLRKTHNLHFTSDYGVEAIYNHVKSQAKIINILNQVESSTTSRYPDGGSNYSSLGIYFSEKINLSKNLLLYSGARWTATNIKSKTNDPFFVQFIDRSFSVKNNAFTGSLGLNYTLHQHHIFSTSLSQGFRSPNVDDLGKIFESTVGQITIPNSKLNPEKALTYDLTYNYRNKNLTLEMNLFYTWLTDAITLEQTQLNNQDSIYLFDTWNKIFSLQNKQSANIYGASYQVKWKLNDQWMINHDLTYTVGKISSDKSPLDHIPPIVGNLGINYMHNHTELSLLTQFNGNKPLSNYRLNTEDNEKYATPYGTLGWMTFTVRASKIFKDQYKVVASIDNILDTQYRRFGSGISSTGRNFVISFIYGK